MENYCRYISKLALAVFAGLLVSLGQQPYNSLLGGILGVCLFVYLLKQSKSLLLKDRFLFSISWATYATALCIWLQYFGVVALLAFALTQFLFALGFVSIYLHLSKRNSDVVVIPLLWVLFEVFQSSLPNFAFSWLSISTIFVDTFILQIARLGGHFYITFVVILVSVVVVEIVLKVIQNKGAFKYNNVKKDTILATSVIGLILLSVGLGAIKIGSGTETAISVASTQGNDKNRELTTNEVRNRYLQNSHIALASNLKQNYDLLVFPESAFNKDPNFDAELFEKLSLVSVKANDMVILNTIADEDGKSFNRNYFYSPEMELLGFYDKQRLVPFGEYVPFNALLGDLSVFDPIGEGFTPGDRNTVIDGVASLICYESTFSRDVRSAVADNAKILVVTTNNRSYRRSGNADQHIALTRMRAAEQGISIVHSSIAGPSALIERDGTIIAKSEMFKRSVITGSLSYGSPDSIYAKTGDWLTLLSVFAVGYLIIRKRKIFSWKNRT